MGARRGERGLEAKSDPQTGHNDDNRIRHLPLFGGTVTALRTAFSISNYRTKNAV